MKLTIKYFAEKISKLPLKHFEYDCIWKNSRAVFSLFLLISILFVNSCKEPIGIESSLNTSNLSDYKYLKLELGDEFLYEVSEFDENGNPLTNIRYENWQIGKIDTIDNILCYRINVYDEAKIKINTIYISTNLNLVSLNSKYGLSLILNESQINPLNYQDFTNHWDIISKYNSSYADTAIVFEDTIRIFNSQTNSNDNYIKKIKKIQGMNFQEFNVTDFRNAEKKSIVNILNTNISEIIEKIDLANNSSLYNEKILINSLQEIQFTKNVGITRINAQITELISNKAGNHNNGYIIKSIQKKLLTKKIK